MFKTLLDGITSTQAIVNAAKFAAYVRTKDARWNDILPEIKALFDRAATERPDTRDYIFADVLRSVVGLFYSRADDTVEANRAFIIQVCVEILGDDGPTVDYGAAIDLCRTALTLHRWNYMDIPGFVETALESLKGAPESVFSLAVARLLLNHYMQSREGVFEAEPVEYLVERLSGLSEITEASLTAFVMNL